MQESNMFAAISLAFANPVVQQLSVDQTIRETTVDYTYTNHGFGFSLGVRNHLVDSDMLPTPKIGFAARIELAPHWSFRTGLVGAGPGFTAALGVYGLAYNVATLEVPLLLTYHRGNLGVTAGLRSLPAMIIARSPESIDRLENLGPTLGVAYRF